MVDWTASRVLVAEITSKQVCGIPNYADLATQGSTGMFNSCIQPYQAACFKLGIFRELGSGTLCCADKGELIS